MTLFKRSPRGKEIQGASSGACLLPPEEGGKLSGWKQVKRDMAGGGGGARGGAVLAHRPSIWEIKARRFDSIQPETYVARPCLETSNPNGISTAALLKGTDVQR